MGGNVKLKMPAWTRQLAWGALLTLLFSGLDAVLFRSLPVWGLSYGSARPVTLAFALMRGTIWAAGGLLLWIRRNRAGASLVSMLIFNLVLSGLAIYGFTIEPFHLTTTQLSIPVAGLKRTLRIVQLSDLHVERTTRRERDLVELVKGLQPDVIVMTGDYLNLSYLDDPIAARDLRWLVGQLYAPQGIYAVDGTVEDPPRERELFAGLDVRVLDDEVAPLAATDGRVNLVGLDNIKQRSDSAALRQLMADKKPAGYNILLYHTPDLIYSARDEGLDLYLAGHTHGGQVRLPLYGAIFTLSIYGKSFEQGLYQVGGTQLYVSRGIGMEGNIAPRVRFLAPPEVVVVDLIPGSTP